MEGRVSIYGNTCVGQCKMLEARHVQKETISVPQFRTQQTTGQRQRWGHTTRQQRTLRTTEDDEL